MKHRNSAINSDEQQALSPHEAFERLKAGNMRYVKGTSSIVDASSFRSQTIDGQYPHAAVLSCIDSRVPVEMIFDQHIGDIFVARVAGNFENPGPRIFKTFLNSTPIFGPGTRPGPGPGRGPWPRGVLVRIF